MINQYEKTSTTKTHLTNSILPHKSYTKNDDSFLELAQESRLGERNELGSGYQEEAIIKQTKVESENQKSLSHTTSAGQSCTISEPQSASLSHNPSLDHASQIILKKIGNDSYHEISGSIFNNTHQDLLGKTTQRLSEVKQSDNECIELSSKEQMNTDVPVLSPVISETVPPLNIAEDKVPCKTEVSLQTNTKMDDEQHSLSKEVGSPHRTSSILSKCVVNSAKTNKVSFVACSHLFLLCLKH